MKSTLPGGLRTNLVTIVVLVLPALMALQTVETPRPALPIAECVSPFGYTYSLAFFLVPVAAMLLWLRKQHELGLEWRACRLTLAVLVTAGYLLDCLFGNTFFRFENQSATLGVFLPGWDAGEGWKLNIPIEEFGFYLFGLMLAMVGYLWADIYWLRAYHVEVDAGTEPLDKGQIGRQMQIAFASGLILIMGAVLYKSFGPHGFQDGFPGWFTFIVIVGVIPTLTLLPSIASRVNWRAFQMTFLFITLVSVVWEVTLAVPYQWWGYRPEQMMGLMIGPWSNLPIEQPILWVLVTWQAVTSYEFARISLASRHPKGLRIARPILAQG